MSYEVIYADPPWRYSFSRSKSRKIENQYETLSVANVRSFLTDHEIPVSNNAVLYLWATAPKLTEAMGVMQAWGFEYKSCAVWDKEKIGMGYWFRGQHELLLVGTRGKFSPPRPDLRYPSVVRQRRGRHSAKPIVFRDLIRGWFIDRKAIEIFARWPGDDYWDTFGNEAS